VHRHRQLVECFNEGALEIEDELVPIPPAQTLDPPKINGPIRIKRGFVARVVVGEDAVDIRRPVVDPVFQMVDQVAQGQVGSPVSAKSREG
jgi:hypothetical protein